MYNAQNNSHLQGGAAAWRIYKHCLCWAGPAYEEPRLTPDEARTLLRGSGAWMLRNTYDYDCQGPTNFWDVICDEAPEIESLSANTRSKVRRSFKNCEFRRLTREEFLAADAYTVYREAFGRYRNVAAGPAERDVWERSVSPNAELWGVFLAGTERMIAFAMNTVNGNGVNYNVLKAIPEHLSKNYPFYGLLFTMTRHYLAERGFRYVTDGWRSVTEHSNIQPFLIDKFHFRRAYCHLALYYAWWLRLAVLVLYPFRSLMPSANIRNVLRFETIRRGRG